jgi:hypothetical protein
MLKVLSFGEPGYLSRFELHGRGVGVRVPVGTRIFSSPRRPDRFWGSTQPPIQWVPLDPSPGVKRPEREANQSSI